MFRRFIKQELQKRMHYLQQHTMVQLQSHSRM